MSWKPSHIQGMLEFVAEIAVKVCGVDLVSVLEPHRGKVSV